MELLSTVVWHWVLNELFLYFRGSGWVVLFFLYLMCFWFGKDGEDSAGHSHSSLRLFTETRPEPSSEQELHVAKHKLFTAHLHHSSFSGRFSKTTEECILICLPWVWAIGVTWYRKWSDDSARLQTGHARSHHQSYMMARDCQIKQFGEIRKNIFPFQMPSWTLLVVFISETSDIDHSGFLQQLICRIPCEPHNCFHYSSIVQTHLRQRC